MPKTIIFPYPFKEQCDMALCSNPKKHTIAVEGSHPSLFFGICEYHMGSLLDAIANHPELGPKMADKLVSGPVVAAMPDQTDENKELESKPMMQQISSAGRDSVYCPYCNEPFKHNEVRDHMKKCNAGGERF